MNLEPLISVVGKSAPLLASALGSPIAGIALGLIENLFGIKSGSSEDLAATISADPDAAIKLKQLELQHSEDLQKITADTYSTEVKDRESARQREVDVDKATGTQDWVVHALAIGYTIGFFSYVLIGNIYPQVFDKGIFHDLLNVSMIIYSYYFGSCHQMSKNN